jgi:hypothetical protein
MSESTERWLKILGLGLLVWLAPFLIENCLYYLQMYSEQVFNPLLIIIGTSTVLIAAASYLPGVRTSLIAEGWVIGIVWYGMCLSFDSAFYLTTTASKFNFAIYFLSNGWMHLYIPIAAIACGYLAHAIDARSGVVSSGPTLFPIR